MKMRIRQKMNKKGISDNLLYSMLDFMLMIAVILSVIFLVKMFIVNNIDTSRVESRIFMARMMHSPGLLAYEDAELGRVYPGTIDLQRFNQTEYDGAINRSYYYGASKFIASRMTLSFNGEEKEIYYNQDQFNAWQYFAKVYIPGAGSAKIFEKRFPVTVVNTTGRYQGILHFEVVIPNS
jgi:hypothetical protein